ncbi:DUF6941 family protein [Methylobacterium phyllosphaerae]|uniref:DUF6941 family protein n=1 Tax=Methylobacterium phyllosphaerae TaxID=418223 RepID=UPI003AAEFA2E
MLHGNVIYCDDVRVENTGKLILVGVYNTDMVVNARPPASLAQIQLVVRIRTSIEYAGDSLKTKIYLPTDHDSPSIIQSSTIPNAPPPEILGSMIRAYPDAPITMNMSFNVKIANVIVEEDSFIKVEVECKGETARLNQLRINVVQPQPSKPA